MIDPWTMSWPPAPVEVWLDILGLLDYRSLTTVVRLNRSFRELCSDPCFDAARFRERAPDAARIAALRNKTALSGDHVDEATCGGRLRLHPLLRCVDWSPTVRLEHLVVRWDPDGNRLARPVPLLALPARFESASSPTMPRVGATVDFKNQVGGHRNSWRAETVGDRYIAFVSDVMFDFCSWALTPCIEPGPPASQRSTYGESVLRRAGEGPVERWLSFLQQPPAAISIWINRDFRRVVRPAGFACACSGEPSSRSLD